MNGRYEIPEMELCNPNKKQLYMIKNVKNLKMTLRFLNCSELSFTAYSEINGIKTPYFDKLEKNRLIHVEGFGYFVIYDYKKDYSNIIKTKEITAYSAEFLLNNKGINLTFVTSSEDSTTTYSKSYKFWEEIDRYSDNPVSLLGNLLLVAPQWSVGYVSDSLLNQYRSFSESDDGLYGFLNNTVSESYSALFVFDYENYIINAYDTNEIVKPTSIIMTFDNLIKNAEINELNNDIYTVLNVKGAENLSISKINPTGSKQIFMLNYYVGDLDENSENYYKNYNEWIDDENLRYKVLKWQEEINNQIENTDNSDSYGYLLELQNKLNRYKLTQEAVYSDEKTKNESAQMILSNYLDDTSSRTESGNTTRYNYWKKKQYAYEYNMNVLKTGGTMYNMEEESLFDSDASLGQPNGQIISSVFSINDPIGTIYAIDTITQEIENVSNKRQDFVKKYSYDYYFTKEEKEELEPFLREGEYQDSTFIITDSMNIADYSNGETYVQTTNGIKQIKDLEPDDIIIDSNYVAKQLYDAGYKKIKEVSVPSFSFSMNTVNLFFVEKFKTFASQMDFGAMINVELDDGEWVYPYFQEMEIDYDNPDSFSITFGNRFRLSNAEWTWAELHNSTNSAVSSVNSLLSSVAQPVTNGTIDRVTSYIDNTLIAANQSIQATSDNEFTFGGYGIRGRKLSTDIPNYNGYSGEQIWLSNNKICFTSDGWDTSRMVFGKISDGAYGVVADTLVGKLIAGNNLVITNANENGESTFYVDSQGAKLTNCDMIFNKDGSNAYIKINAKDGILVNNGSTNVFQADMNGNVSVKGYVTTTDLSTSGASVINGDNIKTGTITSTNGLTQLNLNDGTQFWKTSNAASLYATGGRLTIRNENQTILWDLYQNPSAHDATLIRTGGQSFSFGFINSSGGFDMAFVVNNWLNPMYNGYLLNGKTVVLQLGNNPAFSCGGTCNIYGNLDVYNSTTSLTSVNLTRINGEWVEWKTINTSDGNSVRALCIV